jgi:hypothetical protein
MISRAGSASRRDPNELEFVSVFNNDAIKLARKECLTVVFDEDVAGRQPQRRQESRNRDAIGNFAEVAIDLNGHGSIEASKRWTVNCTTGTRSSDVNDLESSLTISLAFRDLAAYLLSRRTRFSP